MTDMSPLLAVSNLAVLCVVEADQGPQVPVSRGPGGRHLHPVSERPALQCRGITGTRWGLVYIKNKLHKAVLV